VLMTANELKFFAVEFSIQVEYAQPVSTPVPVSSTNQYIRELEDPFRIKPKTVR